MDGDGQRVVDASVFVRKRFERGEPARTGTLATFRMQERTPLRTRRWTRRKTPSKTAMRRMGSRPMPDSSADVVQDSASDVSTDAGGDVASDAALPPGPYLYVHPDGEDAQGGGDATNPFRTIQYAVDSASGEVSVLVAAGDL